LEREFDAEKRSSKRKRGLGSWFRLDRGSWTTELDGGEDWEAEIGTEGTLEDPTAADGS